MTEAEVVGRLQTFCNADVEPALTPNDVEIILSMSARVDRSGVIPGEENWTETFDWNYAVAQGWLIKAGRLADRYLFMTGGKMLSRHQFYDHCMMLHHKYMSRANLAAMRLVPDQRLSLSAIPSNVDAGYSY